MRDGKTMTTTNSATISKAPHLSPAQVERLAYMAGELAEAQQAIAKILRHGYFSYDPTNPNVVCDRDGEHHPDNKDDLETEIGHVLAGIHMLVAGGDLVNIQIHTSKRKKLSSVLKWLHHQSANIIVHADDYI